jgi:hypothetical protein
MIQTIEDFWKADTLAEGLTIPFDDVYAILDENGGEVEEHNFRLKNITLDYEVIHTKGGVTTIDSATPLTYYQKISGSCT